MSIDLRDHLRAKYGTPREPSSSTPVESTVTDLAEHRAFAFQSEAGRTVITAPLREVALKNDGFMYLHGRFVEADTPNGNGALWTTEDLQLGASTVAGGPLNWLHDERKIIGTLLAADLVYTREEARDYSTDKRKKMASGGKAMSDGSFPIANAQDLANAIRLAGNAKDPAAARRHIIKRARALGLSDRIPDSWREKAALEIGNHIASTAAVWRFLFPEEARTIERAAEDAGLFYSMECVSRQVACVDSPGRPGCGEVFPYADYDAKRTCAHLNERSAIRRFVDPIFLGGAVIVPPVRPGWANAEVDVIRQAAALTEEHDLAAGGLSRDVAGQMTAQILMWANR